MLGEAETVAVVFTAQFFKQFKAFALLQQNDLLIGFQKILKTSGSAFFPFNTWNSACALEVPWP